MADETWDITVNSVQKLLTFETCGRLIESNDFIKPNQAQDVTIGGVRMVKNLGQQLNQYEYGVYVPISSVSQTDADDVLEFLGSTFANYAVNSFVWTNDESVARTVRMISDGLSIQTVTPFRLFRVILEEVNS